MGKRISTLNGDRYNVSDSRVYDAHGQLGTLEGNKFYSNNGKDAYIIDQYGNVVKQSDGSFAGKIDGDKYIPDNKYVWENTSSNSPSNFQLFHWYTIPLLSICGFILMFLILSKLSLGL